MPFPNVLRNSCLEAKVKQSVCMNLCILKGEESEGERLTTGQKHLSPILGTEPPPQRSTKYSAD